MREYVVISVGHTKKRDKCITLWRPNSQGYCWGMESAGRYTEAEITDNLDYFNGGHAIAVLAPVADALVSPCPNGVIDNYDGPILRNSKQNWKILQAAVIQQPSRALPLPV